MNDVSGLVSHLAGLRLCIFGRDAEPRCLLHLASKMGIEVCLASPDEALVAEAIAAGGEGRYMAMPHSDPGFSIDAHTAAVLLFHDHDWELDLLQRLLSCNALFVGAMGSRRTHANRLEQLRQRGVGEGTLKRVTGPIGLIPSARDPQTLAISVLAQVVDRYNAAVSGP